jgi:hypothetical protein
LKTRRVMAINTGKTIFLRRVLAGISAAVSTVPIAFHSIAANPPKNDTKTPPVCLREITQCIFYPKATKPHIYDSPTSNNEFRNSWPMTEYSRRPLHYFNDWVVAPGDFQSAGQRVRIFHLWSPSIAWIERADIVRFSELRPVNHCWPIKHLDIENGDAPGGTIQFRPNGLGMLENPSGGLSKIRVAAWFAEGVYSVRPVVQVSNPVRREDAEYAWGNIDFKNQIASHRANWIANSETGRFEGFAGTESRCKNGPIVK